MTSTEKILCEIVFKSGSKSETDVVTGKIDLNKLFSPSSGRITVENKIFRRGEWKKIRSVVHRCDVVRITVYKAHMFFTFDEGEHGLNRLINNEVKLQVN